MNRREFNKKIVIAGGALTLLPTITSCTTSGQTPTRTVGSDDIPLTLTSDWDPIAYNRIRGNAGAIPESYLPSINGPDGENKHLGKHLPYIPNDIRKNLDPWLIEAQATLTSTHPLILMMWGDPDKGHAKHPNAAAAPDKPGHWYNWIKIREATNSPAEEVTSRYSNWPANQSGDTGSYLSHTHTAIDSASGKDTIYVAALPKGLMLGSGKTIRIHAHCLTHGEYVDFLVI